MQSVITCIQQAHDPKLLGLAALVCFIGVFGSFSIANHAGRAQGSRRRILAATGLVAAGSTAWATHMILLLAFQPGMEAGFEPFLTALSLVVAIVGIGFGMQMAAGEHSRMARASAGGLLGCAVVLLHYIGQVAYVVRGTVEYDMVLVAASVSMSLPIFALSLTVAGERNKQVRIFGAPLLLLAIAVLHLSGMASLQLTFDPRVKLPITSVAPDVLAPIVATVCVGLGAVALLGLRLTLHAQAVLRREKKRLGELANLGLEGLAICEGNVIATANESLERLTKRTRTELAGADMNNILPGFDAALFPEGEEVDANLINASGNIVPVRVIRSAVRLGFTAQTVYAFRDQSERLRSEQQIRTLAYSDHLTGLANRTYLLDLLTTSIEEASDGVREFALLLIDLDGFKAVNDALGQQGGDEVLKVVAARLRQELGSEPVIARLGGDEFAILSRNACDPVELGIRVVATIEKAIPLRDQIAYVSASIGAVRSAEGNSNPAQVLNDADLALYKAKVEGRGQVRVFHKSLRRAAIERSNLAAELRNAWEDRDFELYYQPQVRLSDRSLVGAEALIRWNYPYRGVLAPGEFLPVLETSAFATDVGYWILLEACRQASTWRAAGHSNFRIGVNLFGSHLRSPDFVEQVQESLRISSLPPEALELEVTENIVLQNESLTIEHLLKLRRLGVGIAFDDFGTGFASLTMLKRIQVDRLKIDRSFIRNIAVDSKDQAIVDAIARMASACGHTVIAEGLETEKQAELLQRYAAEGQGYLFGRPMKADGFAEQFRFKSSSDLAAA